MKKSRFLPALLLIAALLFTSFAAAEETEPTGEAFEKYEYTIDYHSVPELTAMCVEPQVIDGAIKVVDAFFAHETKVDLHGLTFGEVDTIGGVLYRMCPPVMALTDYNVAKNFNKRTGVLTLNYTYDADETMEKVAEFEASVDSYMSLLCKGDSEAMRAMILYYAFAFDGVYDHDIGSNPDNYTPQEQHYREGSFSAITNHSGICTGFSNGLAFLYNLAGIPADMVQNFSGENGTVEHAWVIARIDGESYFIDPTWGIADGNEFGSVYYFGMTANDRFNMGGYTLENTTTWYNPISNYAELTDSRFEPLHVFSFMYVEDFIPNHADQTITISSGGYTVTFDASTR